MQLRNTILPPQRSRASKSYPDAEAKVAEDNGLAWIGDATGVSRPRGNTLVVVADRRNADPNGRTINQLVTLAAK